MTGQIGSRWIVSIQKESNTSEHFQPTTSLLTHSNSQKSALCQDPQYPKFAVSLLCTLKVFFLHPFPENPLQSRLLDSFLISSLSISKFSSLEKHGFLFRRAWSPFTTWRRWWRSTPSRGHRQQSSSQQPTSSDHRRL